MNSFAPDTLDESIIDDMEVGRCSCGLVFYSIEYALSHVCLGHDDPDAPEALL